MDSTTTAPGTRKRKRKDKRRCAASQRDRRLGPRGQHAIKPCTLDSSYVDYLSDQGADASRRREAKATQRGLRRSPPFPCRATGCTFRVAPKHCCLCLRRFCCLHAQSGFKLCHRCGRPHCIWCLGRPDPRSVVTEALASDKDREVISFEQSVAYEETIGNQCGFCHKNAAGYYHHYTCSSAGRLFEMARYSPPARSSLSSEMMVDSRPLPASSTL